MDKKEIIKRANEAVNNAFENGAEFAKKSTY